jgi:hypothetical protein
MIDINIDKAKEILKDKIRAARAPQFQALDIAYIVALETGDVAVQQSISKKKQALRDLTKVPEIANAEDVEALKNVWDADLLGPAPFA